MALPPRVIVVMADQWPRANLRAALREVGYDAIGTRSIEGALAIPAGPRDRGPVGAVVIDGALVGGAAGEAESIDLLTSLRQRHGRSLPQVASSLPVVLLASSVRSDPPGEWTRIVRRPFSIEEAVRAVSEVVPLPPDLRRPIDVETADSHRLLDKR